MHHADNGGALNDRYGNVCDVEGCDSLRSGAECTLKTGEGNLPGYRPVPFDSVGVVGVSSTPASVTFTVLEVGYFDAPGSTIEFRTEVRNGKVWLTQNADGHRAHETTLFGVKVLELSKVAWEAQQKALTDAVEDRYGNWRQ